MSRILLLHHSDLLTGPCSSFSCRAYGWLIGHPGLSWWLYLGSVLLELSFFAGFFTRRRDRWLIGLACLFVLADLLLMRIPYWTILLGTVTLWLGSGRQALGSGRQPAGSGRQAPGSGSPLPEPREKGILIYETTHHENLPALLDLSEAHFSRVAVFLKAVSYSHLSGERSPEERWPKTEFFIQASDCGNRRFIVQVFTFLRQQGYTHLHLATLDNNLLLFAFRLAGAGPVHLSLTVHEVNEYFSFSFLGLRDISESVAKVCLHRVIRHYIFFLPAMAERFEQKLPSATTVFIPSRFYSSSRRNTLPLNASSQPGQDVENPFTIVIPGSVDPNRRNYEEVVRAFTLLLSGKEAPLRPIELVILGDSGTPYGARIVASLQQLECARFRLRCFEGYIPEADYEEQLAGADLIWSPLKLHKKSSRNSDETYGQTTASGLTADLLLNNAPALVPEGFIVPELFRAAILTYGSPEEWTRITRLLLRDPVYYDGVREKIHAAFSFFSKENFSAAFRQLTGLDQ